MKLLLQGSLLFFLLQLQIPEDYYSRGIEKSDKNDCKGAIEDFTRAIERNPEHDLAFFNRAVEKMHVNDHAGAVNDFSRFLEMNPTSSAFYGRAKSHVILANYEEALNDFTQAIELDPGDISSYFDRGMLKLRLGNKQSGREDIRKARELGKVQMVQQLSSH